MYEEKIVLGFFRFGSILFSVNEKGMRKKLSEVFLSLQGCLFKYLKNVGPKIVLGYSDFKVYFFKYLKSGISKKRGQVVFRFVSIDF